jgi:hypothetical protein
MSDSGTHELEMCDLNSAERLGFVLGTVRIMDISK